MAYDEFDRLKNLTVESIELKDGEVIINDDYKLSAYGDCCSHGWLSDLVAPAAPFVLTGNYNILGSENIEHDHPDFPQGGEVVYRDNIEFQTDKGILKFYMWNDSNGYYGSTLQIEVL